MNGLLVLVGSVVLGLGSGAAYYSYKQPKLAAELAEKIAAAPKTPEGRVEAWLQVGGPQVHHRLSKFARFSAEMPWLVTHAVAIPDSDEVEIWGIECEALPRELARREGLLVIVDLPAPRRLARGHLGGDQASVVPVRAAAPDSAWAAARLADLAVYLLGGVPDALSGDIEGARLEIRVAGAPERTLPAGDGG